MKHKFCIVKVFYSSDYDGYGDFVTYEDLGIAPVLKEWTSADDAEFEEIKKFCAHTKRVRGWDYYYSVIESVPAKTFFEEMSAYTVEKKKALERKAKRAAEVRWKKEEKRKQQEREELEQKIQEAKRLLEEHSNG